MSDVITIEALETEISQLQKEQAALPKEYEKLVAELAKESEAPKSGLNILATLKAKMDVVAHRLGLLLKDKEALELERDFQRYEEMTKEQFDHYTQLQAIDNELEAMQERRNQLIEKASELKGNNQVPSRRRIDLGLKLSQNSQPNRERLAEINSRYRVGIYM